MFLGIQKRSRPQLFSFFLWVPCQSNLPNFQPEDTRWANISKFAKIVSVFDLNWFGVESDDTCCLLLVLRVAKHTVFYGRVLNRQKTVCLATHRKGNKQLVSSLSTPNQFRPNTDSILTCFLKYSCLRVENLARKMWLSAIAQESSYLHWNLNFHMACSIFDDV